MFLAWIINACLLMPAAGCLAQEHDHGPAEKLGTVHFATSCNENAQQEINRAVREVGCRYSLSKPFRNIATLIARRRHLCGQM
jgi:hypothetical protein